jgi:isoleucyl-tRNA synthetase
VVLYPHSEELRTHLTAIDPKAIAKILIVSQAEVAPAGAKPPEGALDEGDLAVAVEHAEGAKCQRCWVYSKAVGQSAAHPTLCDRCVTVV